MAFRESTGTSELTPPSRPLPFHDSSRQATPAPQDPSFVAPQVDEPPDNVVVAALKGAPPWLISAIVHMVVLIVMALLLLPQMLDDRMELEASFADTLGEQLVVESDLTNPFAAIIDEPVLTPEDLLEVLEPIAEPGDLMADLPGFDAISSDPVLGMVGIAYDGRQAGSKESLLGAYGGTVLTQQAVLAGLEWLARNQQKDGSWSLQGPYADGGGR